MNVRDGIIRNLWKYLTKVRPAKLKVTDELIGTDLKGNKYLIRRGDPMSKREEVRYMLSPDDQLVAYEHEVPLEWDAWLRHTRHNPPTLEELQRNILEKEKIQEHVQEIKLREEKERASIEGVSESTAVAKDISALPEKPSFPVYDDLERTPGQLRTKYRSD